MAELKQTEIARIARVSQATVSRVLNNDPQVNEELRQRVMAAVEAYDYVPDARAQSLRNSSKASKTLGLVVHRAPSQLANDPFFSALIAAILDQGGKHGYHLCVDAARTIHSRRAIYEELLRSRRVDGLILVESETDDERISHLDEQGFPFVLIGRYERGDTIYSVDNDNVGAAKMATEYLIGKGHSRIAYIGGPSGLVLTRDRLTGYRLALEEAGLKFDSSLMLFGDFTERSGCRIMRDLLALSKPPTAVLALDDMMALGAMRAAKQNGRRIPDDIAIIGFNNSPLCSYVEPPITSVAVDIPELAKTATGMLIDLIEGCAIEPKRRIVPSHLVIRGSA
jgi:DNA-binding LacI/PurR family transcriptional regulator